MRVVWADAMGMCFGVRDALQMAESLPNPARVTIFGQLVHNEQIAADLRQRGFHELSESGRRGLPPTSEVLVTAHGVSDVERRRLEAAGKSLIDTTCPLVRHVHATAQRMQREGRFVIVIGRRTHVEVEGIVGDLIRYEVVEDAAEVSTYPSRRLGVVCQSTTAPADAERVRRAIEARNPDADIRYEDTICRPTRDRQQAAQRLLDQVEAVVVVGGRGSNNTLQLVRLAESRGVPVLHVQTACDLDANWLSQFGLIGLTAGTSTPDGTVDDVYRALLQIESRSEACR